MTEYQKELIREHRELSKKIKQLEEIVYNDKCRDIKDIKSQDDLDYVMGEFGNMCIQLSSYRKAKEALTARLYNNSINICDDHYCVKVTEKDINKENIKNVDINTSNKL